MDQKPNKTADQGKQLIGNLIFIGIILLITIPLWIVWPVVMIPLTVIILAFVFFIRYKLKNAKRIE